MFSVIDTLYNGKHSLVQRCKDNSSNTFVICKFHKDEYPSVKLRNKFLKEFKIGSKFAAKGVAAKVLELRKYEHAEVLLFEDEGLQSLSEYFCSVSVSTKCYQYSFKDLAIRTYH